MKSVLTDLLILTAISAVVAAVMFLPQQRRCRVEKNWGEVYYDAPITKEQATKVLNKLVESGVFDGQQVLTHSLRKVGGTSDQPETLVWAMMYQRNYREVLGDTIVKDALRQLHAHVFANNRMTVQLLDEAFTTDDAQKVDDDWGPVFFDSPIAKKDATRFAQAVLASGGYDGTIHMIPDGRSITYRVQRDPATLETAGTLIADAMRDMANSTFPEDRVKVVLIDRELEEFEVLVEPSP